jgi:hypothetical protein
MRFCTSASASVVGGTDTAGVESVTFDRLAHAGSAFWAAGMESDEASA